MSDIRNTESRTAENQKSKTRQADSDSVGDTLDTRYDESQNDIESPRSSIADDAVSHLGVLSPLHLLTWTPSDFKRAQMKVIETLERKKHELRAIGDVGDEHTAQIAAIDAELRGSEETREVSSELSPSWEDFVEQKHTYEVRIKDLEKKIVGLKTGNVSAQPPLGGVSRDGELEKRWLDELSCPRTTEEWETQVRLILSDILKRENELGAERRAIFNYRADLDYEKARLWGYRTRIEGDICSVKATSNELVTMITNVRNNLQKQQENHNRVSSKATGGQMTTLDAMLAAEHVFKPTHELAEKIAVKVKATQEAMSGFWEGGEKRRRSPWELIRAIRARDDRITGLESEVKECQSDTTPYCSEKSVLTGQACRAKKRHPSH